MVNLMKCRAVVGWNSIAPLEIATVDGYALHIDEDGAVAFSGPDGVLFRLDDELRAAVLDTNVPPIHAAQMGWTGKVMPLLCLIDEAREMLAEESPGAVVIPLSRASRRAS